MIHGMHNEPWRKRLFQGESRLRLVKNTYGRVSWVGSEPGSMRRLPVLCWWPWPTCRMTWGRFAGRSNCIGVAATLLLAAAT
jgi:hypothetical protein